LHDNFNVVEIRFVHNTFVGHDEQPLLVEDDVDPVCDIFIVLRWSFAKIGGPTDDVFAILRVISRPCVAAPHIKHGLHVLGCSGTWHSCCLNKGRILTQLIEIIGSLRV
jgi:hypothetical protein